MHTGNHRRHPRIYRPIEVNYHVGEESYRDSTMSLSMGGLYVKTDRPMEVGSLFHVDFTLPGFDYLFKAWGKVIWIKTVEDTHGPPGMGVKFLNVHDDDKRALLQYLAGSQMTKGGY